jgi:hypothetical protein
MDTQSSSCVLGRVKHLYRCLGLTLGFAVASLPVFADPISWTSTIVTPEPSQANPSTFLGTWMRLLHLRNGSWLAATSIAGSGPNTYISLRWSNDNLRSWSVATILPKEIGRDLDNPVLVQLPDGKVLLGMRSIGGSSSRRIEVWTSADGSVSSPFVRNSALVDDVENPDATSCPFNTAASKHPLCGVWEPYFVVLPKGDVAVFYSDESQQKNKYNQVIVERVSTDDGSTWGSKTNVVSKADSTSRPGMPYVTLMKNGQFMLSYEVCDEKNRCPGGYKTSRDGVIWKPADLGKALPASNSNPIVQSLSNGMLIMVSGSHQTYWSGDYGAAWNAMVPGFDKVNAPNYGWQSIYQVGTDEIALVDGPSIRIGKVR